MLSDPALTHLSSFQVEVDLLVLRERLEDKGLSRAAVDAEVQAERGRLSAAIEGSDPKPASASDR